MKFNQTFLLISIASALVIFGLTIFLILQFSFLVGIISGLSAFFVLIITMMILTRKQNKK